MSKKHDNLVKDNSLEFCNQIQMKSPNFINSLPPPVSDIMHGWPFRIDFDLKQRSCRKPLLMAFEVEPDDMISKA